MPSQRRADAPVIPGYGAAFWVIGAGRFMTA